MKTIEEYHLAQNENDRKICDELKQIIDKNLKNAESKIWHAHPVWFLEENPIVGYSKLKDGVRIMFWSGQSFDEAILEAQGKFKAATILLNSPDEIPKNEIKNCLEKAEKIQWDYKNIVKRKGKLEKKTSF